MATGTPRRRGRRNVDKTITVPAFAYPGKRTVEEILAAAPGIFEIAAATDNPTLRNRLYYADNLEVLAHLNQDPDVRGCVRLAYIDPPYATQTVFQSRSLTHAYEDIFDPAEYLEFMRERLILLHRLLASDGSIYVHLDARMMFYVKIIMDEIFGSAQFRNCITRRKSNPKNYTRKQFGNVSDYILFYTKSDTYVWNRQVEPWTEARAREYQYVEPATGRRFMKVPIHAPGRRNGATGQPWRNRLPPPGKHWQFTPATLDEMDARGEIYWSRNGNPRRKVYFDESLGVPVQDIWLDFIDAHNQNIAITGYPTEKPIELLSRIVQASSNPGDLVLDCFAGSGTTLVAADMLNRHWIGVDSAPEALRTMLHRFRYGTRRMGDYVSKPANGVARSPTLSDAAPDIPAAAREVPPSDPEAHVVDTFTFFVSPSLRAAMPKLE